MDILLNNEKIMDIFNELMFGKYSEINEKNYLIINNNIKDTYFLVTETDESKSVTNFIERNIITKGINENQIEFESNIFNILVVTTSPINSTTKINNELVEVSILSLFEYLFSKTILDNNNAVSSTSNFINNFFNSSDFSLLHYDIKSEQEDIVSQLQKLMEDNNFQEILNSEDTE